MSKMVQKRKRRKASKLLKSLPEVKFRRNGLPPNKRHKTDKDYNRRIDKNQLKEELSI
jgi:hypothetical protein